MLIWKNISEDLIIQREKLALIQSKNSIYDLLYIQNENCTHDVLIQTFERKRELPIQRKKS